MTAITVNAAKHNDIGPLVASVAALFREDGGRHDSLMDLDWPAREGAAYCSALLDDETCLVALARDGGQVIGHLIGKLTGPGSLRTGRIAVLESMRVAPGSRRAGSGSLLVQHFFGWARDRGAREASVTAYAANHAAQRFYERHGFAPRSVTSRAILWPASASPQPTSRGWLPVPLDRGQPQPPGPGRLMPAFPGSPCTAVTNCFHHR
jgi:GNAT superfamily N-acetyltransferase